MTNFPSVSTLFRIILGWLFLLIFPSCKELGNHEEMLGTKQANSGEIDEQRTFNPYSPFLWLFFSLYMVLLYFL